MLQQPFSLAEKVILVTGASSGIGRETAIACSRQGATLVVTGRNIERLSETVSMLDGEGHISIQANLTDDDQPDDLVNALPRLDGVVCNAGMADPLLLRFTEKEDVDKTLDLNAKSVIHLIRLLVQNKKLNRAASVVFISSINGNKCAYIGSSLYAASKAMLSGFMKAAALELAVNGIRVNSVEPGMIDTHLLKDSAVSEEELEKDRLKYPLKRYGKPEEVAWAVVYLLSDATQWMTGSAVVIDGGYTLQ